MPEDGPMEIAKGALTVVGELIKAAGDSPNTKIAANNLGIAAVTLTGTLNTLLLPFAAINFGVEKARTYFTEHFSDDLHQKLKDTPAEQLIEPKSSIAGPAIQGLAYSHEENDLKEMYLNLLSTAMRCNTASTAHPSFVEIIKQLSAEDAQMLQTLGDGFLTASKILPVANIMVKPYDIPGGGRLAYRHLQRITYAGTDIGVERPNTTAIAENWSRLGLLELLYDLEIQLPGAYDWVEQRPEFLRLRQQFPPATHNVFFAPGVMRCTEFGARFAKAVGLTK